MITQTDIQVATNGRSLLNITEQVASIVTTSNIERGICNVFIQHTSASLIISENADPAVGRDLERFLQRLIPDGDPLFEHDAEGPDDMPAHVRSVLTSTSISVPINKHRLLLGTWQGIYLWEHRYAPQTRAIVVSVYG